MTYKTNGKTYIGTSDMAELTFYNDRQMEKIHFGQDGSYNAYICNDLHNVPEHYKKVATFTDAVAVKDDNEITKTLTADIIDIYRAGEMGIIINLIS